MCWCPDLAPLPRFKHGVRCACARTRSGTRPKSLPEGKANSEALCLGDKEFAAGEQLSPWRDDLGWLSEPSTHPLVSSLVNRKQQQGQQPSPHLPKAFPNRAAHPRGAPAVNTCSRGIRGWDAVPRAGPGVRGSGESPVPRAKGGEPGNWVPGGESALLGCKCAAAAAAGEDENSLERVNPRARGCPRRTQRLARSRIPRGAGSGGGWPGGAGERPGCVARGARARRRGAASLRPASPPPGPRPSPPSPRPRPRDGVAPSPHRPERVHKAAGEGRLRRRALSSEITGVINIPVPAPRSVRVASLPRLPLSSPRLCPPGAARGAAPEARSRAGATEPGASPTRCTSDPRAWKNELVLPPPPPSQPPDPLRLGSRGEAPRLQRATRTGRHG